MRLALTALANNGANLIIGLLSAAFLGPQAFGQFAIAMLIASLIQSCALDWLRLAAARFYAPSHKRGHGSLRGSLDILFVITAMVITIVCIGISAFIPTGLPFDLLLMALAFALINGFFDYQLALLRARFRDLLFSRMVISKIILSVVLTLGLAYGLGSSLAPLIGLFSANVLALMLNARVWRGRGQRAGFDRALARQAFGYSWPLIFYVVVVLVNALINRSLITYLWGYAETGRFSLAYDLGARIINALGLSFDFIFFQFAVRRQHQLGRAQAQMQLKDNLTLLLAVLMPACCGLWLVLPALEASLIAQDFHSSFALYLSLLLPGFFCLALAQFGLNPLFQIDHRTLPICGAALLGLISNGVLLLLFFDHLDGAMMAIIQSVSSVVVMMALGLMAMRSRTQWPEWHAIAHIMCGCIIMTFALWPLRYWHAGLPLLMVEIAAGAFLYLLYLWFVNFAGLRAIVQNIALNFGRHS